MLTKTLVVAASTGEVQNARKTIQKIGVICFHIRFTMFPPSIQIFSLSSWGQQIAALSTIGAYARCINKCGGRFYATMLHSKERVKIF
jgi:hypothetical protein